MYLFEFMYGFRFQSIFVGRELNCSFLQITQHEDDHIVVERCSCFKWIHVY